ncbi:hypothetical protein FNF29_06605 [Cafeteria roenbergensis]|uniref:Phosphodiesterase n=1 Tax=Cafeteria roenbergensis TaxID=33653 RepID=A0A5A8C785_CAFRO|nr:hypothetical protein FNF29_06605 [Cafeteria roenbergensis]|eukprot:KAA0148547.1 hypothetical protein FNF29_06605 [Cafeteria roenbergensis]
MFSRSRKAGRNRMVYGSSHQRLVTRQSSRCLGRIVPVTDADASLVEAVAASAGLCLEKASLVQASAASQRTTASLLSVVRAGSQGAGVGFFAAVDRIVELGRAALGAERLSLMLVDAPRNELWVAVSNDIEGRRLPLSHGLAGSVVRTSRGVLVSNVYLHPQFNRSVDSFTGFHTRSMLALPVTDHGSRVVGVLSALNKCGVPDPAKSASRAVGAAVAARMRVLAASADTGVAEAAAVLSGLDIDDGRAVPGARWWDADVPVTGSSGGGSGGGSDALVGAGADASDCANDAGGSDAEAGMSDSDLDSDLYDPSQQRLAWSTGATRNGGSKDRATTVAGTSYRDGQHQHQHQHQQGINSASDGGGVGGVTGHECDPETRRVLRAVESLASVTRGSGRFPAFTLDDVATLRGCCLEISNALRRSSLELLMVRGRRSTMGRAASSTSKDGRGFAPSVSGTASVARAAAAAAAAAAAGGGGAGGAAGTGIEVGPAADSAVSSRGGGGSTSMPASARGRGPGSRQSASGIGILRQSSTPVTGSAGVVTSRPVLNPGGVQVDTGSSVTSMGSTTVQSLEHHAQLFGNRRGHYGSGAPGSAGPPAPPPSTSDGATLSDAVDVFPRAVGSEVAPVQSAWFGGDDVDVARGQLMPSDVWPVALPGRLEAASSACLLAQSRSWTQQRASNGTGGAAGVAAATADGGDDDADAAAAAEAAAGGGVAVAAAVEAGTVSTSAGDSCADDHASGWEPEPSAPTEESSIDVDVTSSRPAADCASEMESDATSGPPGPAVGLRPDQRPLLLPAGSLLATATVYQDPAVLFSALTMRRRVAAPAVDFVHYSGLKGLPAAPIDLPALAATTRWVTAPGGPTSCNVSGQDVTDLLELAALPEEPSTKWTAVEAASAGDGVIPGEADAATAAWVSAGLAAQRKSGRATPSTATSTVAPAGSAMAQVPFAGSATLAAAAVPVPVAGHPLATPLPPAYRTWSFDPFAVDAATAGPVVLRLLWDVGAVDVFDAACWGRDLSAVTYGLGSGSPLAGATSAQASTPQTPPAALPADQSALTSPSGSLLDGAEMDSGDDGVAGGAAGAGSPGRSALSRRSRSLHATAGTSASDAPLLLHGPTLLAFVEAVRRRYRDNAFHGFAHGLHVCQAAALLARDTPWAAAASPLDRTALLLAALSHDVDHPAVNNAFMTAAGSPLALRYNDQAVLENHHTATTFAILHRPATAALATLSPAQQRRARRVMVQAILATDMARHFALVEAIKTADRPLASDADEKGVADAAEIILHAADVSGQVQPWRLASRWSDLVSEEFAAQVRREESVGLPATPFMANLGSLAARAELQANFCSYVLLPMWRPLSETNAGLGPCAARIESNRMRYAAALEAAKRAEAAADEAAAAAADDDDDVDDDDVGGDDGHDGDHEGGSGHGGDGDLGVETLDADCSVSSGSSRGSSGTAGRGRRAAAAAGPSAAAQGASGAGAHDGAAAPVLGGGSMADDSDAGGAFSPVAAVEDLGQVGDL